MFQSTDFRLPVPGAAQETRRASRTFLLSLTWPLPAHRVMVSGTFNNWQKLVMRKTCTGFESIIAIPISSEVFFRFLVDRRWTIDPSLTRVKIGKIEYNIVSKNEMEYLIEILPLEIWSVIWDCFPHQPSRKHPRSAFCRTHLTSCLVTSSSLFRSFAALSTSKPEPSLSSPRNPVAKQSKLPLQTLSASLT